MEMLEDGIGKMGEIAFEPLRYDPLGKLKQSNVCAILLGLHPTQQGQNSVETRDIKGFEVRNVSGPYQPQYPDNQ